MNKDIALLLAACTCTICNDKGCIHRDAKRRLPVSMGGLELCPNLNYELKITK